MAFAPAIPLIAELAGTIGAEVAGLTGSELLGTAAQGGVLGAVEQAVESGSKTIVDNIFGEGSFENLETFVSSNYTNYKNELELLGQLNQGEINSQAFVKKYDEEQQRIKHAEEIKAQVKSNQAPLSEGVSKYMSDFSSLASTGGYNVMQPTIQNNSVISNVLNTMSKINPLYSYISSKLVGKLADFVIPDSPEYIRVSSIYTGAGIGQASFRENGNGFDIFNYDEIGEEQVWKLPEYNTYTVVPPVWGVWTGINSPNNSLPIGGVVDGKEQQSYLDRIAMLHDIGYHDIGSFNEFSDYQLISRAKYGKDNGLYVFPGEEAIATSAIAYFSTLGVMVRKFFGPTDPLIKEIHEEIYNVPITDEEIVTIKETITNQVRRNQVGKLTDSSYALRQALDSLEIQID